MNWPLILLRKYLYAELHTQLADYINELIKYDFEKLIAYLYRIDVNEQKLKTLAAAKPAGRCRKYNCNPDH